MAPTDGANVRHGSHCTVSTSAGAGRGDSRVTTRNTGHSSFSTVPSVITARYRNVGSSRSTAGAGSPSSSASRRLTAAGSGSPGPG